MQQLPITTCLGPYFPKYQQKLFYLMVIAWQDEANNCHEQTREPLSIQHQLNHFFQSGCLATDIQML